jgi:meso-butanediol dehydrogenase / (S,S)-butanediol dehydrogenase / diacetyl reductase
VNGSPFAVHRSQFTVRSWWSAVAGRDTFQRFLHKTVLITGASRGIGAGLARRFAQEDANLVLSANETRVQEVAAVLEKSGANAVAVICDVTSKSEVENLFAAAVKRFGAVDVSIQNAGVITIAKVEDLTEAEWDKVMDVKTKGSFSAARKQPAT